jgi:hypothetical protein
MSGITFEPFAGSLATLLRRPHAPQLETVNDKDAFLCNVWRALQADPEGVAAWCDAPVNEADQHAIHTWLVAQRATFTARLMGDPDYYDGQIAGRWLYGVACWIGADWCSGNGAWYSHNGEFVHLGNAGVGVYRKRVHLSNAGQGVHRQLVHLGNAGQGVHRKRVHLGNAGRGVHCQRNEGLYTWFAALQQRLRRVRVCCGDWHRVLGPSVTVQHGVTGILLDPPYSAEENCDLRLYAFDDSAIAHAVRDWCHAHGQHPLLRIVLCGLGDVHDALVSDGWKKVTWKAQGGYGNQRQNGTNTNKDRETLWLSPHCLPLEQTQLTLF